MPNSEKASCSPTEHLGGLLLGRVLIEMGVLATEQVDECLTIQRLREGHIKIGQIFLELGLVNKEQLEHALASQK